MTERKIEQQPDLFRLITWLTVKEQIQFLYLSHSILDIQQQYWLMFLVVFILVCLLHLISFATQHEANRPIAQDSLHSAHFGARSSDLLFHLLLHSFFTA